MDRKISKAVVAGLGGTLAMTVLMLMAPLMGMPPMPIGKMLAEFMGIPEVLGWVMHFMIGVIIAINYAYLFSTFIKSNGFLNGAIFGLIPWFMAQIIVNPMMGAGIFAIKTSAPFLMVLGSLMGHLVYGAVLGGIYGTVKELKPVQSNI